MYLFIYIMCTLKLKLIPQPFNLPRPYKDGEGVRQQPGLKDLPNWLHESF